MAERAPGRAGSAARVRYDGVEAEQLAHLLGVPRLALHASVPSTMDIAHALAAAGAPAGSLVLADAQSAGRGRQGHSWRSASGQGIWLTLLEREVDPAALGVLSVRLGLGLAAALDPAASSPVRLKWPNDLYVGGAKLAGILVETRWSGDAPEWVAIGVGLNVRVPPAMPDAAALRPGTGRVDVLADILPVLRRSASERGALRAGELDAWRERDLARGRRCRAPVAGVVRGITADGAVEIAAREGPVRCITGSLILEEE